MTSTKPGPKAWTAKTSRSTAVFDGFHVTGFLNAVTGAKFKTVLDSVSKPTDPDDTRTGAQRRIDGFDTVLTSRPRVRSAIRQRCPPTSVGHPRHHR